VLPPGSALFVFCIDQQVVVSVLGSARFTPQRFGGKQRRRGGEQQEMRDVAEKLMHRAAGYDPDLTEQDIAGEQTAGDPEENKDDAHGRRALRGAGETQSKKSITLSSQKGRNDRQR
jgi:hypothetical protein